ncbi:MAG: glycosyltransferase family 9 protein [Planctomycetota bacterium]
MSTPRHVLVRAPNWVGDLVMATPMLEAILADPRFERVTIAVRAHLVDVLRGGPCEPHVLPLARGDDEAALLRAAGADAALLLSNSFGAAWRAWRARIPLRLGASLSGRAALLTHRVVPPRRRGRRAAIPTAHLLRDVTGLLGVTTPSLRPRLYATADERDAARAELVGLGLGADEGYVLASPGAAFGAAKLWPPERFAAALDELHARRGLRGVVTGGPGEEPLMEAVVGAARHPALSLAEVPRDLHRLKALVRGAAALVVGDSGPRWYAAAFGVPCVTVLGPNSPELTASSLERCAVVRVEDLECSPCLERVCPLGHHRCMRELAPERVVEAAERLLGEPASPTSTGAPSA